MKNKEKRKRGWQSLGEGVTVLGRVVGLLFAEKMVFEQRLKWSRRELCRCLGENIPSKGNSQCKDCQEGARLLCSRKTQKTSRAGTVCVSGGVGSRRRCNQTGHEHRSHRAL